MTEEQAIETSVHHISHDDYLAAMKSMDDARSHLDKLELEVANTIYKMEVGLVSLRQQFVASRADIGRAKQAIHTAYHRRRELAEALDPAAKRCSVATEIMEKTHDDQQGQDHIQAKDT